MVTLRIIVKTNTFFAPIGFLNNNNLTRLTISVNRKKTILLANVLKNFS